MRPAVSYFALLAAGLLIGATGVAVAADSSPSADPSASTENHRDKAKKPGKTSGLGHGKGHGHGRNMGKHLVKRGVLHGEYVVAGAGGSIRSMVIQQGEVTAVSATSISLKSADGFARSYAITDQTRVKARAGGIATIEKGTKATVVAVKSGSDLRAQMIRNHQRPKQRDDKPKPVSSPSGAST